MADLTLITYDWVPPPPRGFVRDLRVRWALEEAGLPYRVKSTPFRERGDEHRAHQPFEQTPWLTDGDISVFESGAILMHLGSYSEKLYPTDPAERAIVLSWVFGALSSVEVVSLPWWYVKISSPQGKKEPALAIWNDWLTKRLAQVEKVVEGREWLASSFSIADILLADVLRIVDHNEGLEPNPACRAYVARATGRPAFVKAHADQLAHFARADQA